MPYWYNHALNVSSRPEWSNGKPASADWMDGKYILYDYLPNLLNRFSMMIDAVAPEALN